MRRKWFVLVILTATVLSATSLAQNSAPIKQSPAAEQSTAAPSSTQQVFRITPVRPIAELRAEALQAKPPQEPGKFEPTRLVDLAGYGEAIRFEIRYATANNFLGEPVYEQARAFLQFPAANALLRVRATLQKNGFGLLVYDAYRPWYVTKIFWEATPVDKREFVADPAKGSSHNRGCAVDLTLYDLKTGAAVAMPSGYDEMTPRAYANYSGASAEETKHREILRKAMEKEGFKQRANEWWHYDYKDWQKYAIVNLPFDQIRETKIITQPKLLKSVEPAGGEQGTVILPIVIDVNGVPGDIRVVQSLGAGPDKKAIEAIKQWRFEPGKIGSTPVAMTLNVEVNFHIGQH